MAVRKTHRVCISRFVTQLLMDLVYFVTEHDSSGEDILNILVETPNRDRQKLMREQNILKEVRYLLYNNAAPRS